MRSNCAIMSHSPMTIVDEPGVGSSTIVAQVLNTTFIVTSFGAFSSRNNSGLHEACFRSDCSRKPADPTSTARCYEKRGFSSWGLDFKPMASLLNNSDLVDLCFVSGGFYDVDTDNLAGQFSECGFSNPTLLIHMTGNYSDAYSGSRGHDHATAKVSVTLRGVLTPDPCLSIL